MFNGDRQNKQKFGIDKIDRFSQIEQTYQRKKFIEINPKLNESMSMIKVEFTKYSVVILLSKYEIKIKLIYRKQTEKLSQKELFYWDENL